MLFTNPTRKTSVYIKNNEKKKKIVIIIHFI